MKKAVLWFPLVVLAGCAGAGSNRAAAPGPRAQVAGSEQTQCGGGVCTVETLLQGKTAGLEVRRDAGGSLSLRIRGMASINGSPPPLILVDGMEYNANTLETALAGLVRDDIRNVEVLKDVASTNVYGMRAAGGVILISTTKNR